MSQVYDCFSPTSPIQRILIAHLNLYALCGNGKSLGENASLEEISEEIFYYHKGNPVGLIDGEDEEWNLTPVVSKSDCLEEAVSFLGLCKALHALPSSLIASHRSGKVECKNGSDTPGNETDVKNEKSNSIYFGNSVLVFVPLESTPDLVAFVQVSRLYQNGIKSDTGSGNPLAISAAIERTHRLFCLLCGGGILHRLNETSCQNRDLINSPRYAGMKKLYGLLKEIRKQKESLMILGNSSTSSLDKEEITRHLEKLESEVKSCRRSLPIQSIRRELDSHYNEFLSQFLEVCIRNGGAGRCLVEMMPIPIAENSESHIFQLLPSKLEQRCLESLEESILQAVSSCSLNEKGPELLGIAVFTNSRLLHSYSKSKRVDFSNDTLNLLMAYMASYRSKMRYATISTSSPGPQQGLLKRLAFHLGPMVDRTSDHITLQQSCKDSDSSIDMDHERTHRRGRFLPPPPPFMLGASYQMFSFCYDNNRLDAWAPRVHFPCTSDLSSSSQDTFASDPKVAHMVVFEFRGFSFLIFIDLSSKEIPGSSKLEQVSSLLMKLERMLSESISQTYNDESFYETSSESIIDFKFGPGQNAIFVEKPKERMVLLMDQNPQAPQCNRTKRAAFGDDKKDYKHPFMKFGLKRKTDATQLQASHHRFSAAEWSAFGLDCRHLLASRLPLDVCLAFDDMITDIGYVKHIENLASKEEEDEGLSASLLELCTCMSYGWIYALATREKEIYVFFDSSIYVTIADVQSEVLRIKEKYFVAN